MGFLGLLDTRATSHVPWPLYARVMLPYLAGRFLFHLKQCLNSPPRDRLRYLRQKANWFRIYLTRTRGKLPVRPISATEKPADDLDMMLDYFDAVAMRYQPTKYEGDVALFAGEDARYFHHSAFWKHLVLGRVQVHRVAGSHGSMISSVHAPQFASVFKQALKTAETPTTIRRK